MKFGSKKAIFGVIWGGFEGFGPCLGVSHPTHPHLGEISQKKPVFFFGSFPYQCVKLNAYCSMYKVSEIKAPRRESPFILGTPHIGIGGTTQSYFVLSQAWPAIQLFSPRQLFLGSASLLQMACTHTSSRSESCTQPSFLANRVAELGTLQRDYD